VEFVKAADKRLTLAPLYSPGEVDLHGEFATENEIEKAVVAWNETGDRTLRLQHQEGTAAGEVLSVFIWPSGYEAPVYDHRGLRKAVKRFAPGTAFAWVRWTPEAWQLVKTGRVAGLSIGGSARRIRIEAETPALAKRAPQTLLQRVAREGSVRLT